jgi:prepilin-type N-terminal cleavage/methylation domain-containing protein
MKLKKTDGFTIIELLIATAVFSVVLLTISASIIQIGRLYFKGITSARTQETARVVMTDISQAIQFNTGEVKGTAPVPNGLENGSNKAICVTTKQYSYRLGRQHEGDTHALVVNNVPSGCGATAAVETGTELLGDHMRLANLVVEQQVGNTNAYKVLVRVVYGDDDLLCSPSLSNCESDDAMTVEQIAASRDLQCKNIRSGTQFCAASELSTIVERRL